MSLTLGEKLRQAREARGLSISEVAEQTRISAHHLQSIENDDYRTLPGGIFNKGFIKSYAKFVGVDDQEALADYSHLMSQQNIGAEEDDTKTYRPEVLTDESNSTSLGTLLAAGVILALLAGGVYYFLNYWNAPQTNVVTTNSAVNQNVNVNTNANVAAVSTPTPVPVTNEIKVEFTPTVEPISVGFAADGKKLENKTIAANEPLSVTGQESVRISYYRGFTPDKVKLTVNGKQITPPMPPKGNINFEINKSNVGQILESGKFPETVAPALVAPAAR